jgi:hypothetical protein
VATYGAESWTLNKDIAKRLATLKKKSYKKNIWRKENWRKRYNKELTQLFGDLDVLSFVRISRLN